MYCFRDSLGPQVASGFRDLLRVRWALRSPRISLLLHSYRMYSIGGNVIDHSCSVTVDLLQFMYVCMSFECYVMYACVYAVYVCMYMCVCMCLKFMYVWYGM